MKTPIPIHKEDHHTYHADTCQPLIGAANAGRIYIEVLARGNYPGWLLPDFALLQVSSVAYWDAKTEQFQYPWTLKTMVRPGIMGFGLEVTLGKVGVWAVGATGRGMVNSCPGHSRPQRFSWFALRNSKKVVP